MAEDSWFCCFRGRSRFFERRQERVHVGDDVGDAVAGDTGGEGEDKELMVASVGVDDAHVPVAGGEAAEERGGDGVVLDVLEVAPGGGGVHVDHRVPFADAAVDVGEGACAPQDEDGAGEQKEFHRVIQERVRVCSAVRIVCVPRLHFRIPPRILRG